MRGILDAIFWRLHASFLLNVRDDAHKFLAMLEDEEKTSPPGALLSEIGPKHYGRYDMIRKAMSAGQFGRLYPGGNDAPAASYAPQEPSCEEKDFCRRLMGKMEVLMAMLDAERAIVANEVDMEPYGRCDFILRAGRVLHVVEVKVGEAPSSVVSQVDRYRLAMELDMCMGTHDEVKATVMAESFPPYVTTELSRSGVTMILHRGKPDELRMNACTTR